MIKNNKVNNKYTKVLYLLLLVSGIGIALSFDTTTRDVEDPEWGFYGHRLINKLAVYCLPEDLILFYKNNIEFVTEHAVDPDKRRYATKREAVRHYIDIDAWGTYPFDNVPRKLDDALIKFSEYYLVNGTDSTLLTANVEDDIFTFLAEDSSIVYRSDYESFKQFFIDYIRPQYYEDDWIVTEDTVYASLHLEGDLVIIDEFSHEGILPYNLLTMKFRLTKAFSQGNIQMILRLSADIGHYIGDAHVPLHTTTNYNGQLTDQIGIHAFWESRIPELFAESQYDFLVGRAEYISNPEHYFWQIVLDSHKLLDDVLKIEKDLSITFPSDKQFCYDERLERTIRVECPKYAEAYQERMQGMVEARMQDAILSISSVWYTCWVDAGQPKLTDELVKMDNLSIKRNENVTPRSHE